MRSRFEHPNDQQRRRHAVGVRIMTDAFGYRSWRDEAGLTIELLTEGGLYSVGGLSYVEAFNYCDDIEAAGDDWEPVAARWANGYRNAQP
jgi:hypothetical protein